MVKELPVSKPEDNIMIRHIDKFRRSALLLALAVALLLVAGTVGAIEEVNWGEVKQIIPTLTSVAKRTVSPEVLEMAVDETSVAADYSTDGGRIVLVTSDTKQFERGDLRVSFIVPEGALSEGQYIEMEIYAAGKDGRRLPVSTKLRADNLVVNFGPDGLVFKETCTLRIAMGPDLLKGVKIDELVLTHWHDGIADQSDFLAIIYNPDTGMLIFKVEVDGFSRYGLTRY
jgi:hypothetical protein